MTLSVECRSFLVRKMKPSLYQKKKLVDFRKGQPELDERNVHKARRPKRGQPDSRVKVEQNGHVMRGMHA